MPPRVRPDPAQGAGAVVRVRSLHRKFSGGRERGHSCPFYHLGLHGLETPKDTLLPGQGPLAVETQVRNCLHKPGLL